VLDTAVADISVCQTLLWHMLVSLWHWSARICVCCTWLLFCKGRCHFQTWQRGRPV